MNKENLKKILFLISLILIISSLTVTAMKDSDNNNNKFDVNELNNTLAIINDNEEEVLTSNGSDYERLPIEGLEFEADEYEKNN